MRVEPSPALPTSPTSLTSPTERLRSRRKAFGILSTYPPTACGLATFSAALGAAMSELGTDVRVVRVADGASPRDEREERVVGQLENGSPTSVRRVVELLNDCDVAVIQHEYGLYGGVDGDEVLAILAELRVPSIVVAHTVLRNPTPYQRSVLVEVAALADHVIVMSEAARRQLCSSFDIDRRSVSTIPHGATIPTSNPAPAGPRPLLLTCGLVGPGKGIERVIEAMRHLRALAVRPRYLVAGQTHPKVLAADGEAYRHARISQAWRSGVAESVSFDAAYRDVPALTALLQSAAVVVLPYDSREQATSGVLVDALAAGRPVVATAFPHAVELLSAGAGIVVDHDDPKALAIALHRTLTEPGLAADMAAAARRLAPGLGWGVVASAYVALGDRLCAERAALV